jgi:hypothetical protein
MLTARMPGALVVHICNYSYSEGRDQQDSGSNPARVNSFQDPISQKRAGVVTQGVGPEFKPQYWKKKKKKKTVACLLDTPALPVVNVLKVVVFIILHFAIKTEGNFIKGCMLIHPTPGPAEVQPPPRQASVSHIPPLPMVLIRSGLSAD